MILFLTRPERNGAERGSYSGRPVSDDGDSIKMPPPTGDDDFSGGWRGEGRGEDRPPM